MRVWQKGFRAIQTGFAQTLNGLRHAVPLDFGLSNGGEGVALEGGLRVGFKQAGHAFDFDRGGRH